MTGRLKLIAVLAIPFGLFIAYMSFTEHKLTEALGAEGKTTSGFITGGTEKKGKYTLNVEYTPEGGEKQSQDFTIGSDIADQVIADGAIAVENVDVVYLPSDPSKARISGDSAAGMGGVYAGIGIAVVGLIATILIFVVFKRKA